MYGSQYSSIGGERDGGGILEEAESIPIESISKSLARDKLSPAHHLRSTYVRIVEVISSPESPVVAVQKDILAAWTGIDYTLYDALDNVAVILETLIKELAILAELGKANAGKKLYALVDESISRGLSYAQIAHDFNALVEYGDVFANLTPSQKEEVNKREIQEEFGHFWRIMGIDSMFMKRSKKIVGELHDVIEIAGTLERELGVIRERRMSRASTKPYLPVKKSAEPEGTIHVQSTTMVSTERKSYPYVSATVSNASEHGAIDTLGRIALVLFNKLLTRYPLEESVALLDFMLFQSGIFKCGLQFVAIQQYAQEGKQYVKMISIGTQTVIHTRPAKNFSHSLMNTYRGISGSIGQSSPATYSKQEFEVEHGDVFYILSADCSKALDNMTNEELTSLLNQRGSSGWILPSNNIRQYIGGKNNDITTQKCRKRREFILPKFTNELISSQLATLVNDMVKEKPLYVAVEGAHVHADRSMSNTQAIGAMVAGLLSRMLDKHDAEIFGAPMVDDDHVANVLDYAHCSSFLEKQGYHFKEIIFESSPLIYEVSLDVLRYLAAEHPDLLKQIGDNLYLKIGDIMIELVEGLHGEFKTGCVLFDAALCLYKLYPDFLTEMYMKHIATIMPDSPFGMTPVHSLMLQIYKSTKRSEDRKMTIRKYLPTRTVRLSDIHSSKNNSPFLSAVTERIAIDRAEKDQYIVTILEGTYNNQQKKLKALIRLLPFIDPDKIITVIFDQESGEVTFNR